MWIWDDAGRFGLPRIAVEAVGATWETTRNIQLNVAFPDGRVLASWANEPPHPPAGADGRARVLGGGPLRLECVEPYRTWRLTFEGQAVETTAEDQLAGRVGRATAEDAPKTSLALEVEATMAVPPWTQGSLQPEGQFVQGESRFEQLFDAAGTLRVDGTDITFTGSGLRIHRQGGNRSDYSDWCGHCWQSARFPSGRAFGYIHHAPRPDGSVRYCEGFVFDGDQLTPARVVGTPWMTRMVPSGQDASFALESALGRVDIAAETYASTFVPEIRLREDLSFPPLQQGIARYQWDGEVAFGMIERSYPTDRMLG